MADSNTAEVQGAEQTVTDPVCGKNVRVQPETRSAEHDGHRYYFCGQKCLEKFRQDPAKYTAESGAAAHEPPHTEQKPAPAGTKYTCPMHPEIVRDAPGSCPICGMALEAATPAAEEENVELRDMTRRFWIGVALSIPVVVLDMTPEHVWSPIIPVYIGYLIELILSTPVVRSAAGRRAEKGQHGIFDRFPSKLAPFSRRREL